MWPMLLSSILPALGYAVLSSLWQGALLWLLYVGLVKAFAPSAAVRFRMAALSSGTAMAAFFFSLLVAPASSATLFTNWPLPTPQWWYHLLPAVGTAYLLLAAWHLLRLAAGWRQVQQLRHRHTSKAPVAWRLFVQRYQQYMGIQKPVQLLLSSRISSPLTIGFLKPVILFPLASVNQLTLAQAEAILVHELAHIRRADYLLNYLLQLAAAVLFFNPFHRLLVQAACRDREISCDEWVLRFNFDSRDYATALLQLEKMAVVPALAMGATSQPGFELLHRIKLLLAPGASPQISTRQRLLWWPTALLLLAMLLQLALPVLPGRQYARRTATVPLLSRLRPASAPHYFLAASAWQQTAGNLSLTNVAAATSQQPAASEPQASIEVASNDTRPGHPPSGSHWLQPVYDLLQFGEATLKATDAVPASALEAELMTQLTAAAARLQQQYEQQLLQAQVLAAEASAARSKELAAAHTSLQATTAELHKLQAALAGQLALEKKQNSLRVSLPMASLSVANAEIELPDLSDRTYQFSYNEVATSLLEIPLFSAKAGYLTHSPDTDLAVGDSSNLLPKTPSAPQTALRLVVPMPVDIKAKLSEAVQARQPANVLPAARPRVIISL